LLDLVLAPNHIVKSLKDIDHDHVLTKKNIPVNRHDVLTLVEPVRRSRPLDQDLIHLITATAIRQEILRQMSIKNLEKSLKSQKNDF